MWLAAHLSYPLQIHIGKGLGLLSYYFARSRRHICEVNLRLCFPELTEQEHKRLVRKTFRSNGIGLIEVAIAWFRDPEDYRSRTTVTGLENLEAAISKGKGVLLLCAHFSSLEMGGFLFNLVGDMDVTYRPNKNPLFQAAMFNGRIRHFRHVYDRKDVRGAMRSLKAARILWYAPENPGCLQTAHHTAHIFAVVDMTEVTNAPVKHGRLKQRVLVWSIGHIHIPD